MSSRLITRAPFLALVVVAFVASMGIVACSDTGQPVSPSSEQESVTGGKRIAPAPGFQPDLVITAVTSNSPLVTACGAAAPNATCGQTTYNVTVSNIGTRRVNANQATVQLQRVPQPGFSGVAFNGPIIPVPQRINPGQSRTILYTLYLGPCDFICNPPLGPVPSQINSVVDPLDSVAELVEGNNNGPTLLVCNQCG